MRHFLLAFVFLIGLGSSAIAEQASRQPADVVVQQNLRLGGGDMAVTTTVGTLPLREDGEQRAWMSYVAYVKDGADRGARPVTFVFNGGPGASSAYLHLGALGPRVVQFGADGEVPARPAPLIDNPDSWLDLSDLVFIDPVGTGYSRALGNGDSARRFWGVREDVQAIAAFIEGYLDRHERRGSPKYLVGESYGGFRAARLAQYMQSERGIAVAGLVLISPVLEFNLLVGDAYEPLPHAFRLPVYAAAALGPRMTPNPAALAEVERFALGPYLAALVSTPRDEAKLRAVYAEVARLTGLPVELVARHEGRIPPSVFAKETRRGERLIVSRYDGAVAGPDPYPESSGARGDPVMDGLYSFLTGAMVGYQRTLGLKTDLDYLLTNGEVLRRWNWRSSLGPRDGQAGATDELREALATNRMLKVVIAHGITDLVTPYLASRYLVDRLPPRLTAGRVELSLMTGGHMMYTRPTSRGRLHEAAVKLYGNGS